MSEGAHCTSQQRAPSFASSSDFKRFEKNQLPRVAQKVGETTRYAKLQWYNCLICGISLNSVNPHTRQNPAVSCYNSDAYLCYAIILKHARRYNNFIFSLFLERKCQEQVGDTLYTSSTQSDSRQTAVKGHVCGIVVILRLLHFFLPLLNAAASLVFRHGSAEDADHLALMRATSSKYLICYQATALVSNVLFSQFPSIFV